VRRGAAALVGVPIVIGGRAVVTFGGRRRSGRAAMRQAAALTLVPELVGLAAVAVAVVRGRGHKRQSGREHNEGSSETGD
jgi:hypothetical protein